MRAVHSLTERTLEREWNIGSQADIGRSCIPAFTVPSPAAQPNFSERYKERGKTLLTRKVQLFPKSVAMVADAAFGQTKLVGDLLRR